MKRCISLLLTVCLLATMAAVPALAEAGTYTGVGAGKNGEGSIEVSVTLDDAGVITDVEVTTPASAIPLWKGYPPPSWPPTVWPWTPWLAPR